MFSMKTGGASTKRVGFIEGAVGGGADEARGTGIGGWGGTSLANAGLL